MKRFIREYDVPIFLFICGFLVLALLLATALISQAIAR